MLIIRVQVLEDFIIMLERTGAKHLSFVTNV